MAWEGAKQRLWRVWLVVAAIWGIFVVGFAILDKNALRSLTDYPFQGLALIVAWIVIPAGTVFALGVALSWARKGRLPSRNKSIRAPARGK